MGGEFIEVIIILGVCIFLRLCYLVLSSYPAKRVIYFLALLLALALGVIGMINSYMPEHPENYNTSFLLGWFLIKTSFWLVVIYPTVLISNYFYCLFATKNVNVITE